MNKKMVFLFAFVLMGLFCSQAKAENSATGFSGTAYKEQQVWVDVYNNSGAAINTCSVVIIDTTATAGTTLGAYATVTSSADSPYVLGVTDDVNGIASGSVGRVIVRGPAKCLLTQATHNAGDSVATSTTSQAGYVTTSTTSATGKLGYVLSSTPVNSDPAGSKNFYWIYVRPSTT